MTTIAIMGHGEAGRAYAEGLLGAGAHVRAYDPYRRVDVPGVHEAVTVADALVGAEAVLSLVTAAESRVAAADVFAAAPAPVVYIDMNTSAPDLKREIAGMAEEAGVDMADVAILAPVMRAGHRTPLIASGSGAVRAAEILGPLGAPVTVVDGPPGAAARLKLLRSVFMKGLAALVIEGTSAARAEGAEEWLRGQISTELGPSGADLVDRLVEGTYLHAVRREHEMRDALALLEETGRPTDMTRATLAWLERIVSAQGEPNRS
ncbi:DUF1932 domain-containing protein [Microbacterium thalassium]|uniref:3-hydroxyisobutyrate dehydrogenase-like beta-hydroxyacid dehydrogenase n=1 Tax=Microbacterium thalassium TaxID=362649 RepID=A0A7X0FNA0_9MICO|nr:DUF1932 domain-containing protein [Microbacterium thalassium]MBB6390623.1 3-hydroxyisobutyrate dehydrogenase-like beta-hydroxyacid dehydrogenase [Microbacterium thalassium]GLK25732.1 hypothetical protein GCM10017607_30510 [Microbacterium thalassium]